MRLHLAFAALLFFVSEIPLRAQPTAYTRQDSLRGSITPERAWWNVLRYDLSFAPDFETKSLAGQQIIGFEAVDTGRVMQIDLQAPMQLEAAYLGGDNLDLVQDGNTWLIHLPEPLFPGDTAELALSFSGKPREAVNPPWDGGWIWKRDNKARPWMSVSCQGIGASTWFPCKDHQSDEPDLGASIAITVPDTLTAVSNGRLMAVSEVGEGLRGYAWEVVSPINAYNITAYIGAYQNWEETFEGEGGTLNLNHYVLDYDRERAQPHFAQVHGMLACFEDWFGKYPFYEDGYKLVQAPFLGMEHQSAIAYGNRFANGYMGMDLSASGWGLKWDFIIVHESGHEWFGNSITTADIADMWVHEGFTAYSEALYVECNYGKEAAEEYIAGTRRAVLNDRPIIGDYGVNSEGSGDMYYKAANMIHMIRTTMDNDSLFREMLRGLNRDFYHSIVTTEEVEAYINEISGKDFSQLFHQYLRTPNVPVLEYAIKEGTLYHRYSNCIDGFTWPLPLADGTVLNPSTSWQRIDRQADPDIPLQVNRNHYVTTRRISEAPQKVD